jgi:hypothetical protein
MPHAMSERQIKAGTSMSFGAPAKPMPEIMAAAISQVVAQVPGIVTRLREEFHLVEIDPDDLPDA